MVETETKIQRYESYKDSGVEWLGEIPEHWKVEKGKWLFKKEKREVRADDEIVTCFRDGEVTLRSNRRLDGFTNALQEHGYQGIRKGDLVIHAMDAFAGAIGVSDSDGKSTPVYSVCTERFPNTVNPFYYAYFLRNLAHSGFIVTLAKGIRERSTDFRYNDFSELLLMFPPLPEQTAIAQFLDDKTTKIDQAIAIKQQQIALLKERKQILIHKAVTRGLDDSVTLKDSGVEWIGEIPEHWEVKRLKHITTKIVDGAHFTPTYVDKGVPFLRVTDLSNPLQTEINWDNVKYIPLKEHEELIKRANPEKGDILLSKNGTIGLTKVIDWDVEFSFFVSLCLIKPTKVINPHYFEFFFNSPLVDKQITFGSSRTSVSNLHLEKIKELIIVLPPLEEQSMIIKNIEKSTNCIDKLHRLKLEEIEKLKEYKGSLINGVVTGKVRVC